MSFSGRGILLIRNPYRALVSYWNHIRAESTVKSNPDLEQEIHTDLFSRFMMNEAKLWYEVAYDWIALGSHLTVVHYEDLLTDDEVRKSEINRILDFFQIPFDASRLKCIEGKPVKYSGNKRPSPKFAMTRQMFREDVQRVIDGYVLKMRALLKEYGFKDLPLEKYDL